MSKPKTNYEIRECTARDIKAVRNKLRQPDADELRKMLGCEEPHFAVIESYRRATECYVGLIDGEIACIWGVWKYSILSDRATVWLFSTEVIEKSPVVVARFMKREFKKLRDRYDSLENFIDNDNTFYKHWLKWLGFTIDEPEPLGCHGELFCHFYIENKPDNSLRSK